jgi:hypothetical protein
MKACDIIETLQQLPNQSETVRLFDVIGKWIGDGEVEKEDFELVLNTIAGLVMRGMPLCVRRALCSAILEMSRWMIPEYIAAMDFINEEWYWIGEGIGRDGADASFHSVRQLEIKLASLKMEESPELWLRHGIEENPDWLPEEEV